MRRRGLRTQSLDADDDGLATKMGARAHNCQSPNTISIIILRNVTYSFSKFEVSPRAARRLDSYFLSPPHGCPIRGSLSGSAYMLLRISSTPLGTYLWSM